MAVSIGEIREDVLQSLKDALPHFGTSVQYGTRPITSIERACLLFAFRDNFAIDHVHMATRVPKHVLKTILEEHEAETGEKISPDGTAGGRVYLIPLIYRDQYDLCESYKRGATVRQLASRYKSLVTGTYVSEQFVRELLKRHQYFEKEDEAALLERRKKVWELRVSGTKVEDIARQLKIGKSTVGNDWKWCRKAWGKNGPPKETA